MRERLAYGREMGLVCLQKTTPGLQGNIMAECSACQHTPKTDGLPQQGMVCCHLKFATEAG